MYSVLGIDGGVCFLSVNRLLLGWGEWRDFKVVFVLFLFFYGKVLKEK